jgi:uncharacterized protein YraI
LGWPDAARHPHPTAKDENMNLRTQPVRVVAAVGAVIAAGTTTFMALAAGSASADEPGRCTQNVNVREEPDANSRIVALCEAGTQVMLGAERDGWVELDSLGGWASKDYVKADENASSSHASDSHASDSHDADSHASDDSSSGSSHDADDDGNHASSGSTGIQRSAEFDSRDGAGAIGGLLG